MSNLLSFFSAEEGACMSAALSLVHSSNFNEPVSISNLPAEILEHIFSFCVSWFYSYTKPKNCLAWTQVCFSWRKISFDSGRLWQHVNLCDSRYADQFLVRSKEAPLSVVATEPLKLTTDNLALHARRLHSIDIFLFSDDMAHLFDSFGGSLTNLTNLSLKVPQSSSALFLDIPLPRVRRLTLECIVVPWNNCRDLTHLSLLDLVPESCPSISQLHQLLAHSAYLEYMHLRNFVPKSCVSDDNITQPFPLLCLKYMKISSEPSVIIALLNGVLLPANVRLELYFSFSENLASIFPHGIPQMKMGHPLDVNTVRLSRDSMHFILDKTQPWSKDPSRSLFSIKSASHIAIRVCQSINHLLDTSCITSLELDVGVLFDIPNHHMHGLLTSLPNLETLSIAYNDLEEILNMLSALQPPPFNLLCPRLVKLSFGQPTTMWWRFGERWLDSIIDLARVRRQYAFPIHTFEFLQCHDITHATVEKLQEIVPLVKFSEIAKVGWV